MTSLGLSKNGRPHVAAAGGSIGGLCAGLALHRAGFDVQVYERPSAHEHPRDRRVVQGELVQ